MQGKKREKSIILPLRDNYCILKSDVLKYKLQPIHPFVVQFYDF